jgi:hypothetical protein
MSDLGIQLLQQLLELDAKERASIAYELLMTLDETSDHSESEDEWHEEVAETMPRILAEDKLRGLG